MKTPLLTLAFTSRFRAEFGERQFTYRHWGSTIRVPYAEIDHVEVTNRTRVV